MNPRAITGRIALIGVGLIGGSLARSLKRAGVVTEVVGTARTESTLRKALELGVIDRAEPDVESAVRGAELVVVATPMQAMPSILASLDSCLDEDAVATDVGSVKGYVADAVRRHLERTADRFVPGHPIAGREHAGVEASNADLFIGKTTILTPLGRTSTEALRRVEQMWRHAGAQVQILDPREHDRLLAATSHLPHAVAYALVNFLAQQPRSEALFALAAGGFYDFTRIASSDPVMWRDICLTNREALLDVLEGYRSNLNHLIQAVAAGDGEGLRGYFERAKQSRDRGLSGKRASARGGDTRGGS